MERDRWWLLLPEPVRRLPADLAATIGLTIITILVVILPVINETPLRVVFGLPFVLFLPGYAFIAALFPEAGEPPKEHDDMFGEDTSADSNETEAQNEDEDGWFAGQRDRGIDGIERVALAFGLSIAIVPLIGLALNFTPWGIRLTPILVSVSAFTIGASAIAAVRRWELPEEERFAVPYHDWIESGRKEVLEPDDRLDGFLNVALALSILLAVGSVGYAIAVPPQGEEFSEFYILTEADDGELVADGYPESFVVGDSSPIVVGVGNQEHETLEYTVVIEAHDVEDQGEGNETDMVILDREHLLTQSTTAAHNETNHLDVELAPTMVGEDVRVTFMLFVGDESQVPENPTPDDAYRSLHIWVDVFETEDDQDTTQTDT